MSIRGYFIIESRWETSHTSPGENSFFLIDEIGGTLDDAKRAAQAYYDRHIAQVDRQLEWLDGLNRKAKCYYAHGGEITLRITHG